MPKEKAITKREDILPSSFTELSSMAKAFVQSGMFTDTKQLSQAVVKIQAGRELGLPPVYSMQNINLIRNRLTTSANTMAMLVKKSGRYNYRIKEHNDKSCTITFYELDTDKWVEVGESTFTIEDAKRASLVKPDSGWEKYPRAMLFSRAISQGARMYCPDAIGGIYTDEEIRSIPSKPEEGEEESVAEQEDPSLTTSEPAIEEQPEQAEPPTEAPIDAAEDHIPTTVQELLKWAISHGKQYTPSWVWKTTSYQQKELDTPDLVASAYHEIKELAGWED